MSKIYNIYAILVSSLGVLFFFTNDYSGFPRSGKILTALLLFLIVCLMAEKIVSHQYADLFLKFFCCISISIIVFFLI